MVEILCLIVWDGVDVFYYGEIVERIVVDMVVNGGLVFLEDFKIYEMICLDFLWGDYCGYCFVINNLLGGGIMFV